MGSGLSHPTHIVSISCLPQLFLTPVGGLWGRVELGFNSASQLLPLHRSLPVANPGAEVGVGQPGVLAGWLLTGEPLPWGFMGTQDRALAVRRDLG